MPALQDWPNCPPGLSFPTVQPFIETHSLALPENPVRFRQVVQLDARVAKTQGVAGTHVDPTNGHAPPLW
jgi:hypothetical protein